jgi:hypothetical protein
MGWSGGALTASPHRSAHTCYYWYASILNVSWIVSFCVGLFMFLACTHTCTARLCKYLSLILNSFPVDKHDDTSQACDLILFILRMFVRMR